MEYVDLADREVQAEFAELLSTIQAKNLPYPLVAVNGRVRLAGTAAYYQVMPLVEEVLSAATEEVAA